MPVVPEREYRFASLLNPSDENYIVEGYATTFNMPYVLYEYEGIKYMEVIDRHALDNADMSDVILQFDHQGKVFARQSNGTLEIRIDDKGLHVRADLSKSEAARGLYEEIKNGLVTKMSWSFVIDADEYNRDTHTRTLLKIKKVYDVSAVSIPANPFTDVSARSFFNGVIEAEKQERLCQMARDKQIKKIKLLMEV